MDDQEIHPTASLESWFGVVEEEVVEFLDKDLDAVIPDVSVRDITEEIEKLTEDALSPAIMTGILEEVKKDEIFEKKEGKMKVDDKEDPSNKTLQKKVLSEDKEKNADAIDDKLGRVNVSQKKSLEAKEEDIMDQEIDENVEKEGGITEEKLSKPKSANSSRRESRVSEENDASTAIGDSYQSEYESELSENGTEPNIEHLGDVEDQHSHIDESALYLNEDETDESGLKTRFNLRKRLPIHSVNEEYGSDDFDQEGDGYKVAKRLKLSFSKKNYRRQRPYTNEAVKLAVKMVMSKKMSFQEASREFKIPRTSLHNFVTLYKRGRRTGVRTISPGLTKAEKLEMVSLIKYESSKMEAGETTTLAEYVGRMSDDQNSIYFLAAPSRELAVASPYFEAMKKKNMEVLFCYEAYDVVVLMQLRQFNMKNIISVEKEIRQSKEKVDFDSVGLQKAEVNELMDWMKKTLGSRCFSTKATTHLQNHPCVVTVEDMGAARHYIRTQFVQMPEETRYAVLQPQLEINPSHPIIVKLNSLRATNVRLAELLTKQLFYNAMVTAGLIEDPRTVMTTMNELLQLALEKH